jgi:hypothetical protein
MMHGGTAEVAEPEPALVLRHLAQEFGAVGAGGRRRHCQTSANRAPRLEDPCKFRPMTARGRLVARLRTMLISSRASGPFLGEAAQNEWEPP